MKNQTLEKKLTLNKKTVANLGDREMNRIQGGFSPACVSVIICLVTDPVICETSRICP